jgi:hypothetical protein
MKRAVVVVVLAVLGAAVFGASSVADTTRDSAVGTGENLIGRISFSAEGGPSPIEPVSGHFTASGQLADLPGGNDVGEFHFEGPVTCLVVVGNRAGLFYPLEQATPEAFEGSGVFIFLEDNGDQAQGDPPDRVGFVGPVPVQGAPPCTLGPATAELEHGDITIRDAP